MIVVADSGPLHYLVLLEHIDLLRRFYGQVLVPDLVASELTTAGAPDIVRKWMATHWRTARTHNARHRRAQDSQCLFASVPKVRGSLNVKFGDFPVEFDEGDGLKNRRLARCKMSIS